MKIKIRENIAEKGERLAVEKKNREILLNENKNDNRKQLI